MVKPAAERTRLPEGAAPPAFLYHSVDTRLPSCLYRGVDTNRPWGKAGGVVAIAALLVVGVLVGWLGWVLARPLPRWPALAGILPAEGPPIGADGVALIAAERRRHLRALLTAAAAGMACWWVQASQPRLVGLPLLIAPLVVWSAWAAILALPGRRLPEVPAGSPRSADLTVRSARTFGPAWALPLPGVPGPAGCRLHHRCRNGVRNGRIRTLSATRICQQGLRIGPHGNRRDGGPGRPRLGRAVSGLVLRGARARFAVAWLPGRTRGHDPRRLPSPSRRHWLVVPG